MHQKSMVQFYICLVVLNPRLLTRTDVSFHLFHIKPFWHLERNEQDAKANTNITRIRQLNKIHTCFLSLLLLFFSQLDRSRRQSLLSQGVSRGSLNSVGIHKSSVYPLCALPVGNMLFPKVNKQPCISQAWRSFIRLRSLTGSESGMQFYHFNNDG